MGRKKVNWKYVALGAVCSVSAVLSAVAIFGRDNDEPKKEVLNAFDYGIYRLDDTTGKKDVDDKRSLRPTGFEKRVYGGRKKSRYNRKQPYGFKIADRQ